MAELTCDILRAAGELKGALPIPHIRERVANLVREMNSYYSNLIEGHRTLPRDIERALQQDFSHKPKERENQLLNVAHIRTQEAMEGRLRTEKTNVYGASFICWLHAEFYRHLPEEMHYSETKGGQRYRITSGLLRDFQVSVGRHDPPHYQALPAFLGRFETGYNHPNILATNRLIACAAAHHRLLWIHPFLDGNGRVVRLQTHACLIRAGVDGFGLWTISRGLARQREKYYEMLAAADQQRVGSLDGRGNLSDNGLAAFCMFFLEAMLDQIKFMAALLEPAELAARMQDYIYRELFPRHKLRESIFRLLKAMLLEGELARGQVPGIICKNESTSAKVIKLILENEIATTPSPKGKLSLAFPAKVLESYFPRLYM